jgi:hypothetical protein
VRLVLRVLAVAERSLSDRVCWTILAAVYKNLRLLMPLATSAFDLFTGVGCTGNDTGAVSTLDTP